MRPLLFAILMSSTAVLAAQAPSQPASPPARPSRAQANGGRPRAIQVMTLTSTAWPDGGRMPAKHTQAGGEVSPPLAWDNVPDDVASFVLLVHDPDAAVGTGTDDMLHWLVWDIPGAARSLPEGIAQGPQLPDGARQISGTGPYYRGPGAPAAGPAHHYVFELYALDTKVDVPAVGASPAQTRAAVESAMVGHVRGKAAMVGLFRR